MTDERFFLACMFERVDVGVDYLPFVQTHRQIQDLTPHPRKGVLWNVSPEHIRASTVESFTLGPHPAWNVHRE